MRPAATLVLARDGASGMEVLLVQRGESGDFPGLHVFPGGLVDPGDADPRLCAASLRDAGSASRLLAADDALPFFVAAVRESLEEVGVLLAEPVVAAAAGVRHWQRRLLARECSFAELVADAGLRLATDRLGYLSHWITPAGIPRRYDTRFLVAGMPAGQEIAIDGREAVRADWLTPQAALDAQARGDIRLIFPTVRTLEMLAGFAGVASLLEHARQVRAVPVTLPKLVNRGSEGMRLLLPGDAGYDEA
ncbi:MAG: NUDIX hydrolase [Pseudomonadota bacterium]